MRKWTLFFGLLAIVWGRGLSAQDPKSTVPALRAGAAAVDITPQQFPLNMPGGFSANMAESAHDPLHARALVFDDGALKLAMVVVDNLGVSQAELDEAKEIAAKETGIPANRMLICSTHTHSAPRGAAKDGPAPEVAYRDLLVKGITAAIIQAHGALRTGGGRCGGTPLAGRSVQSPLVSEAGQNAAQSVRQAGHGEDEPRHES